MEDQSWWVQDRCGRACGSGLISYLVPDRCLLLPWHQCEYPCLFSIFLTPHPNLPWLPVPWLNPLGPLPLSLSLSPLLWPGPPSLASPSHILKQFLKTCSSMSLTCPSEEGGHSVRGPRPGLPSLHSTCLSPDTEALPAPHSAESTENWHWKRHLINAQQMERCSRRGVPFSTTKT